MRKVNIRVNLRSPYRLFEYDLSDVFAIGWLSSDAGGEFGTAIAI